jgi:uncharacterized heparinase superfamily protein
MTWIDALDRRLPRLAFARRIGPARIALRLWSTFRLRLGNDREPRVPHDLVLKAPAALPRLPFHHGGHSATRTPTGWRFTFVGRAIDLPHEIDWSQPASSRADQLWRMNLHYFEYLAGLDRNDGLQLIRQWIVANPPSRPGAITDGWNSYALSIRIVHWADWLALHGSAIPPDDFGAFANSLAAQTLWLEDNLELDLGGNHLMRNIAALAWAGSAFEGQGAKRWAARAKRLLEGELQTQLLQDGVHYERSPSYHCQVAGDLLTVAAALAPDERSAIAPYIARMVSAAGALSHPDGHCAQFNDAGLTMAPVPAVLETAAIELGLTAAAPRASAIFGDAGLAAWHHGDDSLIIKGGALGADDLPAHAHGDAGSIELSVAGMRLIVDQGVFEYVAGDRRTLSRSAAGHNLTQVGQAEQALFFGDFRMGWRSRPLFGAQLEADGRLSAFVAHDAFNPTGGCGMLRRSVNAGPSCIAIVDELERPARKAVISRFLLHPEWDVTVDGNIASFAREGTTVTLTASAPIVSDPAVWWPDMGVEWPTRRILIHWPDTSRRQTFNFTWISEPQA